MARPSKLTDEQWQEVERRLLEGEKPADLSREFGINRAAISRKFAKPIATIKTVANQLLASEVALRSLPIAQQITTIGLLDQLRSISGHLAGAANYGAATAHRLAGIAHAKVQEIDDSAPLSAESMESLKAIGGLTRIANEASEIGVNLMKANKEAVDGANRGDGAARGVRELADDELEALARGA